MIKRISLLMTVLISFSTMVLAQLQRPVKWSYAAKRLSKTEAVVYMKATLDNGWHIYSVNQTEGGPLKSSFNFSKNSAYTILGKLIEPKPLVKYEEVFKMDVKYFEKSVTFQQKIKLNAKQAVVKGKVEFMACTNQQCLPPDEVEFSIPIK